MAEYSCNSCTEPGDGDDYFHFITGGQRPKLPPASAAVYKTLNCKFVLYKWTELPCLNSEDKVEDPYTCILSNGQQGVTPLVICM